jgi:hypothetical protein
VAIAGCVGNLPKQYGYSVCTSGCLHPSDFAFQTMESKQKQPKYRMTLIVDVDINLLKTARTR